MGPLSGCQAGPDIVKLAISQRRAAVVTWSITVLAHLTMWPAGDTADAGHR
jgi:hypothetical protein